MEAILIEFISLIVFLFFIPKLLSMRLNVPSPASELILGALVGPLTLGYFAADDMIKLLSTIGLIVLFFFAGLDVNTNLLKKRRGILAENLVIQILILVGVAAFVQAILRSDTVVALLVTLALVTPSAGFILSAARNSRALTKIETVWIETKTVTSEIVAIFLLTFFMNFSSVANFASALALVILIVALLPMVLKFVHDRLVSKVPETEFSFIFIIALLSAYLTEIAGIHYLMGAFVSGVVVKRFMRAPGRTKSSKSIPSAFNFFAIFFIPFYFFNAGLTLTREMLSLESLVFGLGLYVVITPIRMIVMAAYRKLRMGEHMATSLKIAAMTTPTILFTLVVATILHERFGITNRLFGALVFYGILTTLFPDWILDKINRSKKALSRFN